MALEFGMTHGDVIIFKKNKIEQKPQKNIKKKNFENPLIPDKDMNIERCPHPR